MSESINIENKKQNRQKPPLSVGRIVGEILAGLALGLVALLVLYVTGIVLIGKGEQTGSIGQLAALGFVAIFITVFPPLYGYGSAVGVRLLGSRGNQTGSFLLTLAGGFVGGLVVVVILLMEPGFLMLCSTLLIPPVLATCGFNLRRRYKEPPSS